MSIDRINRESESERINGKDQFDEFVKKLLPKRILDFSIGDHIANKIDSKPKK
jgi:hypothetical protein